MISYILLLAMLSISLGSKSAHLNIEINELSVPSEHYLVIDLEQLLGPTEDYYTNIDKSIYVSSQYIRFDVFVLVRQQDFDCYKKALELNIQTEADCEFLKNKNGADVYLNVMSHELPSLTNHFNSLVGSYSDLPDNDVIYKLIVDNTRFPVNGQFNYVAVSLEAKVNHNFEQDSWPKTCAIFLIVMTSICVIAIIALSLVAYFQYQKIKQRLGDRTMSNKGKASLLTEDTEVSNMPLQQRVSDKSLHDS